MNDFLPSSVWSYPNSDFPEHDDVVWIDADRRRIIIFHVVRGTPVKRSSIRGWYEDDLAGCLRAGLNPENLEQLCYYKIQQEELLWTTRGKKWTWRRLPWEEYPEWLESAVAAAYAKMDELEPAS